MHKKHFIFLSCLLLLIASLSLAYAQTDEEAGRISDTMKNFFQHRFDSDKTQCLSSVSKDYKGKTLGGITIDYNNLKASLGESTRDHIMTAFDNFAVLDLKVQDDLAQAKVEFRQVLQKTTDNTTIENKFARDISLKKEADGWKITSISPVNPPGPQPASPP